MLEKSCKLPTGCFRNVSVKVCPCNNAINVNGIIRLEGYDKNTFGTSKKKMRLKRVIADTTGKSESDVLVTNVATSKLS